MTQKSLSPLHMLWLVPCIALLAWIERQWPQFALWCFVALTLTMGFAHGAMDVWLLLDAKERVVTRQFAAYGASAVLLAAVLLPFPGVALIVLLLLSLWHFGEQVAVPQMDARLKNLLRIVQGGASVMLPVLLSAQDLKVWVLAIAPESIAWVWLLWVGMAGLWLALLVAAIAVVQPWKIHAQDKALHGVIRVMMWELVALMLLNVMLSPLLAFALFFGLYHSGMHLRRMQLLQRREARASPWLLLVATLLLTWAALALLWWQMPILAQPGQWMGDWLRWLVVALAAVTLPHLILVWRARLRLFHPR